MRAPVDHQHVEPGVMQRHGLGDVFVQAAVLARTHDDRAARVPFCRDPQPADWRPVAAGELHVFARHAIRGGIVRRIGHAAAHEGQRPRIPDANYD